MATLEARCLDAFPDWLRSLADDARALASVLESEGSGPLQRRSATALNYLFKSLDLIPDGLEDLGFVDDAFVVRAAADAVRLESEAELAADSSGTLARLSGEAELVQEFLGSEYGRLAKYVAGLEQGSVRGLPAFASMPMAYSSVWPAIVMLASLWHLGDARRGR